MRKQEAKLTERTDLTVFCRNLHEAKDIAQACEAIEQNLQIEGYDLLSVKFCDTLDQKPALRPFSRYPRAISELSTALRDKGGCPISREVLARLSPFDAKGIDAANHSEFLCSRFLQELDKMEHRHIAVVPVVIGRGLAVYTVGLREQRFMGEVRDDVVTFIFHANTVLLATLPEIATLFEPKRLSLLETQIVALYGNGDSFIEISAALGISEFTIKLSLQSAAKKLGAKNHAHLITKALGAGELLNMQSV